MAQQNPKVKLIRLVPSQRGRHALRTADLVLEGTGGATEVTAVTGAVLEEGRQYAERGKGGARPATAESIANAIRRKIFPTKKRSQLADSGGDLVIQVRRGGSSVEAMIAEAVQTMNDRLVGATFLRQLRFNLPRGRVIEYERGPNGKFHQK